MQCSINFFQVAKVYGHGAAAYNLVCGVMLFGLLDSFTQQAQGIMTCVIFNFCQMQN
jgi:hypothetical protein